MRILSTVASIAFACGVNAARAYEPPVNYQLHCMGCHLPDGSGQADRVPSLRRSLALFSATPEGRNYVARVPGVAQSPLTDEETAALLNWMAENLSDANMPAKIPNYSAAEIHGPRKHPFVRVKAIRARLWRKATEAAPPP